MGAVIKSKKKLALHTQTISQLSDSHLGAAQGGRRSQCSYEQSGCQQDTVVDVRPMTGQPG